MSTWKNNYRPSRTDTLLFFLFLMTGLAIIVLGLENRDQQRELNVLKAQDRGSCPKAQVTCDCRTKEPVKFFLDGLEIPVNRWRINH